MGRKVGVMVGVVALMLVVRTGNDNGLEWNVVVIRFRLHTFYLQVIGAHLVYQQIMYGGTSRQNQRL